MGKYGFITIENLSGGESARYAITATDKKFSLQLVNCMVSPGGGIEKIPGYQDVNETAVNDILTDGFDFVKTDGTVERFTAGGGRIYRQLASDELEVLYSGWHPTARVSFVSLGNKMLFCNGVDSPRKYTGNRWLPFTSGGVTPIAAGDVIAGATSAATATVVSVKITSGSWAGEDAAGDLEISGQVGTFVGETLSVGVRDDLATVSADSTITETVKGGIPQTAFRLHVHKGRVWALVRENKLMAYHSALDNPEDWESDDNAGYLDFAFNLRKGDELLDIASYIGLLIFFFRRHVSIYSGNNPSRTGDFVMQQTIENCGVIGTGLVHSAGTDIFFLYDTGVKTLKQAVSTADLNVSDVSENVDEHLTRDASLNVWGAYAMVHYIKTGWSLVLLGKSIWIFSHAWKAWGRIEGADIAGMFLGSNGKLYFLGTGHLYEFGRGWSFSGTEISMKWETSWIKFGGAMPKAYVKKIDVTMLPGAVTELSFTVSCDQDTRNLRPVSVSTLIPPTYFDEPLAGRWDDVLYMDYSGSFRPLRKSLSGAGKLVKIKCENKSARGPVAIAAINLHAQIGGV